MLSALKLTIRVQNALYYICGRYLTAHRIQVPEVTSQAFDAVPLNLVHELCHLWCNHMLVESKVLICCSTR